MKDAAEIAVAEIHDIGDHRHVQRFTKVPLHILLRPDNNLVIAAALFACLLVQGAQIAACIADTQHIAFCGQGNGVCSYQGKIGIQRTIAPTGLRLPGHIR